ncbi:MAG: L,D-transpeptidase [Candidatus Promineifilaceae bacterium]
MRKGSTAILILMLVLVQPHLWVFSVQDLQNVFASSLERTEAPSDAVGSQSAEIDTPLVPTSTPTAPQKRLVVDLSDQRVYQMVGDQTVASFVVSTGRAGQETLPGNYMIQSKLDVSYNYDLGWTFYHWMGIYRAGSLENGFHALPVNQLGQTIWQDALGTPSSYGSILLSHEDAQHLYTWTPFGTEVIVQP